LQQNRNPKDQAFGAKHKKNKKKKKKKKLEFCSQTHEPKDQSKLLMQNRKWRILHKNQPHKKLKLKLSKI
jgi:hypothetical protein